MTCVRVIYWDTCMRHKYLHIQIDKELHWVREEQHSFLNKPGYNPQKTVWLNFILLSYRKSLLKWCKGVESGPVLDDIPTNKVANHNLKKAGARASQHSQTSPVPLPDTLHGHPSSTMDHHSNEESHQDAGCCRCLYRARWSHAGIEHKQDAVWRLKAESQWALADVDLTPTALGQTARRG